MNIKLIVYAVLCVMSVYFFTAVTAVGKSSDNSIDQSIQQNNSTPWFVSNIPDALNWVYDPHPANVCHGRFQEPASISVVPHPTDVGQSHTHITSTGSSLIKLHGVSLIQDHVVITEPGRVLQADKAYMFRNKNGQLEWIRLVGHASLREHNRHVLAEKLWVNIKNNVSHAKGLLYRTYVFFKHQQKNYPIWGRADTGTRIGNDAWIFKQTTYTACSPVHPSWELHAKKLILNTHEGVGKAYHAYMTVHHVPILYFPYIWFPLNDERRTGFLYPTAGYDDSQGYFFSMPWYWNMAPNYDWLIAVRMMSERGLLLQNRLRYLTRNSRGKIRVDINPYDASFADYRQTVLSNQYPSQYAPYVNALADDHPSRYYLQVQDHTRWNQRVSSDLKINYVSDDYYTQDYGNMSSGTNQLFNQLIVKYTGFHWHVIGLLQAYQTLHTFDSQSLDLNQDQYRRLPEVDIKADYPYLFKKIDASFTSQLVNFAYDSDFNADKPTGQRVHFQPAFSRSFNWASGYILPSVFVDAAAYTSVKNLADHEKPASSRLLPILNLDQGLYFNRTLHINGKRYLQTLEPRLFYLYVPYTHQSDLPNFDTYLLPFTYDQLFALNRFTGYDRQSNANQLSVSVTSQLLSSEDASAQLSFGLGVMYYFEPLKVTLDSTNNTDLSVPDNKWSPIVVNLTYFPALHWSLSTNVAWNVEENQLDNGRILLHYSHDGKHIFDIGYSYVYSDTLDAQGYTNSTNLVSIGAAWPVNYRWSALGYFYYDFSKHLSRNFILGVQYDSCCFAIRLLGKHIYIGDELQSNGGYEREFRQGVYLQILLKGLGTFGAKSISRELTDNILGYNNDF
jgi:LPS-assembly protein